MLWVFYSIAMKKIIIIISVFIIVATSISFYFAVNENFEIVHKNYASKIYKTTSGYGYLIKSNNHIIIKQDIIPSLQANQSFCTFKDANNTANLVIDKLMQKQNPSISVQDLKKLNITIDCN
jgi:hypothetical protein